MTVVYYLADIAPVRASAKGVFTALLLLTHTPPDRPKSMDFESSVDGPEVLQLAVQIR